MVDLVLHQNARTRTNSYANKCKYLFRGKVIEGVGDTFVLGFRVQYGILTRGNEGRV